MRRWHRSATPHRRAAANCCSTGAIRCSAWPTPSRSVHGGAATPHASCNACHGPALAPRSILAPGRCALRISWATRARGASCRAGAVRTKHWWATNGRGCARATMSRQRHHLIPSSPLVNGHRRPRYTWITPSAAAAWWRASACAGKRSRELGGRDCRRGCRSSGLRIPIWRSPSLAVVPRSGHQRCATSRPLCAFLTSGSPPIATHRWLARGRAVSVGSSGWAARALYDWRAGRSDTTACHRPICSMTPT